MLRESTGILATGADWDMRVEVEETTYVSRDYCLNSQIRYSDPEQQNKQWFIDVIVPWEERMEEAHDRKLSSANANR